MTNDTMTKETANKLLAAIAAQDIKTVDRIARPFGNKGQMWKNQGCITALDYVKGECSPRLSGNSCRGEHVGCPRCMKVLREIAAQ